MVDADRLPRLNCRGNFVEAPLPLPTHPGRGRLGLTAEATSLRPSQPRAPEDRRWWRLGLTAEATSLRPGERVASPGRGCGLGLTAEATSLRRRVSAVLGGAVGASGLGLTAEATSLRPDGDAMSGLITKVPRLNCRGNFVEATFDVGRYSKFAKGLGLTAEATSLRRTDSAAPSPR